MSFYCSIEILKNLTCRARPASACAREHAVLGAEPRGGVRVPAPARGAAPPRPRPRPRLASSLPGLRVPASAALPRPALAHQRWSRCGFICNCNMQQNIFFSQQIFFFLLK